jgi:predicted nuclease of predicted toxin-antitoxin system
MKLLIDQGLPRSLCAELERSAERVVHIGMLILECETDENLLEFASAEGWVMVTLDIDFHDLLALRRLSKPSVIRVVAEGRSASEIGAGLRKVLVALAKELELGCMETTDLLRVRVRMLPVSR